VVARALADESGDLEFVGAVMDITRRKRAEEAQRVQEREREEMQRQLQQAAKMEAIGRLAGATSTTSSARFSVTASSRRTTWSKAAPSAGRSIR